MVGFYIDALAALILFGVGLYGVTSKSDFLKILVDILRSNSGAGTEFTRRFLWGVHCSIFSFLCVAFCRSFYVLSHLAIKLSVFLITGLASSNFS